jgi:hypothetical protein
MMTTHSFNTLAIGQHTQVLNNRLNCRFDGINATQKMKSFFLVSNEDLIDINTRVRTCIKTHCMRCFFKSGFCQSIKKRKGKQIPPISGINLKDYFLSNLASFSRQVAITQAEKLVFSFLDCSSICSIKSWGKRIAFLSDLLFLLPVAIFIPKRCLLVCRHYTRSLNNKKDLTCAYTIKYSEHTPNKFIRLKKQSPDVLATLSRDLTTNIKRSNAMANSNDTLRPKNRQLDLSNLISVLNLYQADIKSSKKHLHNLNHSGYIDNALAKSKVRIETLNSYLATHDAQSVFFCVNACAHLFINISSMVALVGQPKGWLGHQVTSSLNPVNVTANEIETSSGDYVNHYLEAVTMTTIPTPIISTQKLYKFYDLSTAQVVQTTATTERQARKSLGKSSLIFIARIRLYPVIEDTKSFGGYGHE